MAEEFSFDVVSKVDLQAVDDAVNAANKEMSVRFDFRGSDSRIELDKSKGEVTLFSDDEGKLKSVVDIFKSRSVKRGIDVKSYQFKNVESSLGGKVRQVVKITQGIDTETAKRIVADIKKSKLKATPSIISESVRVSSKSKDVLQEIIAMLKKGDYGIPLQFVNYR